ncbi:MAG: hypothetical protein EXR52_02500 [Dehalococcoidia bacterium]|nr:hypothetical protein [Dehalococcoidia bacterium]
MVRIYLTGPLAVEVPGALLVREDSFRGRQARLLFAYLVLQRVHASTRQELVDLLWPDDPPPAWDAALSALLSRLKRTLGHPALEAEGVRLEATQRQHRMRLPAGAFVDLEVADTGLDLAEGHLRRDDSAAAFGPATAALCILRRPFLPGDASPWAEAEQRRLARRRVRALQVVAQVYLAHQEPLVAVELAAEALACDAFQEESHRLLMRAHAAAGNRAGAIKAYRDLGALLRRELDTEPSEETKLLYQELAHRTPSPSRR